MEQTETFEEGLGPHNNHVIGSPLHFSVLLHVTTFGSMREVAPMALTMAFYLCIPGYFHFQQCLYSKLKYLKFEEGLQPYHCPHFMDLVFIAHFKIFQHCKWGHADIIYHMAITRPNIGLFLSSHYLH
jgi:hypothetical protein